MLAVTARTNICSTVSPNLSHNTEIIKRKTFHTSENETTQVKQYQFSRKVTLNVSGVNYETFESTLNKYPSTLLGTSEKRLSFRDKKRDHIFINRHYEAFEAILYYYQSSGRLYRPQDMCMDDFEEECYFYGISSKAIKRMKERENYYFKQRRSLPKESEYGSLRRSAWMFLETPTEFRFPCLSVTYFLFSYILIITSIAVFCIETELFLSATGKELDGYLKILYILEVALNLFFLIEITVRFIVNPWPKRFLHITLNIIELFSFLGYLIGYSCHESNFRLGILRFSRILRVFRLVRLSKYSNLIKAANCVVSSALNEVIAVTFVTIIVCILCGSIMYFIEMEETGTEFRSIPDSMWWAIQTVLCVGYGDIVPTSIIGKSIGGCVLYIGVVCVTVMLLALGGRIFDMFSKEVSNTNFLSPGKEDYEIHY